MALYPHLKTIGGVVTFRINPWSLNFSSKSIKLRKCFIDGSKLSPTWYLPSWLGDNDKSYFSYLGKESASNSTVSTPSRANTEAVYEPAGPPPMINTVHFSGIVKVIADDWMC